MQTTSSQRSPAAHWLSSWQPVTHWFWLVPPPAAGRDTASHTWPFLQSASLSHSSHPASSSKPTAAQRGAAASTAPIRQPSPHRRPFNALIGTPSFTVASTIHWTPRHSARRNARLTPALARRQRRHRVVSEPRPSRLSRPALVPE